ncbi:MAG: glycosyltransferase family 4 protein [Bacteroidia bacterium]|nr:glycosyltransferase family 4 protein [Bacteroidia bacterium]
MKTLKIGFDAKRIFNNHTGLGVYGRNLVGNLAKQYPANQYFLFTPKETTLFRPNPRNTTIIKPSTPFKALWRSYGINKEIVQNNLDIYHGLSNEIPFKLSKSVKYVCTIHDLIWLRMPETYKSIDRYFYTKKLKHACTNSDIIIATSHQTANDIQELMHVPAHKIRIVYQTGPEIPSHIRSDSPLESPYFFYLSSFQERKNHIPLLKAFANIKDKSNRMLVLAGAEGNTLKEVQQFVASNKLQSDVKILTNISDVQKYWWLKHADAFVYPSAYEGFGIPLIEAMQLGIPLILHDIPVFREIAENTAQYFSLKSEGSLEQELMDFTHNKEPNSCVKAQILPKFSPEHTNQQLFSVYDELTS